MRATTTVLVTALAGCDLVFPFDAHAPLDGEPGAIAFVQERTSVDGALGSCAATLPAASRPGAWLVVTVTFDGAGNNLQAVSDNLGDSYTLALGPTTWETFQTALYYAQNVMQTAPITVTAGLAFPAASICSIYVNEYGGVVAFDQAAVAVGSTGGTISSGFKAVAGPELIFGHAEANSAITSMGAGFTRRVTTFGNTEEDEFVPVSGSYDASFMLSAPASWIAAMLTFR
jgi:hypothetical protein